MRIVLILLLAGYILCSLMNCYMRVYSGWDYDTQQIIHTVKGVNNFSWTLLLFVAAQVLLLLCKRYVLQVFAAIAVCCHPLKEVFNAKIVDMLSEMRTLVYDAGIPPHAYELSVTPAGYVMIALAAVVLFGSIFIAVDAQKMKKLSHKEKPA